MSSSAGEFISVKEAAKLSAYTPAYITRLIKKGSIRAKKQGRAWQVDASSLERYLDQAERNKSARREQIRADRINHLHKAEYGAVRIFHKANTSPFNAQALMESLAIAGISLLVGALIQGVMEFQLTPGGLYEGAGEVLAVLSDHSSPITNHISNLAAVHEAGWDNLWTNIWSD